MISFNELGLGQEVLEAVNLLGFTEPTNIQQLAIPVILESSRDLIALAQTGTGKTGAFGLPVVERTDTDSQKTQVLVLSPTRELAIQIAKDLKSFAKQKKGLKTVAIYGGANISSQIRALDNGCQIVVGTPGRMLDLIRRKKLDVSNVRTLILDEADEMLNMGFQDDLDAILEGTPKEKQTLLFSATMPSSMTKMTRKYMNDPQEIVAEKRNSGATQVEHHYYMVHAKDRYDALKRIVDMNPEIYGIIFCRTRRETSEIASKLNKDGYDVDLLNGDLSQSQRDSVMNRFRSNELQLLIATDVAARGLDVDNLTHVINYNLPDDLEVYIHRSGRTGRAGNSGIAISIVHSREGRSIKALEKMSGKNFIRKEVPSGEDICGIRMLNLIKTVKQTTVNEDQIAPFMADAMEKFSEMSREELIKQFLSVEFNHFLDYYRNARDLNASSKGSKGDRKSGKNGNSRSSNYDRFFINVGRRDGLNPVRLMGVLNDHMNGHKPDFGNIDIQHNFSFFEVEPGFQEVLFNAAKGTRFEGRSVNIEVAEPQKKRSSGKGRRNKKGKRSRQRA